MPGAMNPTAETRSRVRLARRQLSAASRQDAGLRIARRISRLEGFQRAHNVACFLSSDGEVDTAPVLEQCWSLGQQVWLPVIAPKRSMRFARYDRNTQLLANRLGILEPDPRQSKWLEAADLDLVLTPLVAFDARCNRIGMGGGYYDRAFAFLLDAPQPLRPLLVGIAYELQRVERIEPQHWDIPLSMVVTPSNVYRKG